MTTFHLTVVTPDGCAFEGQAERIVCRAIDGDIAILARHGDYCTALGMGEAHIVDAEGKSRRAACMGGLLSVLDGEVRLVATTWEWAEDIDQARAEASKKRAEEILARKNLNDREYELAQARLKRALVRTPSTDLLRCKNRSSKRNSGFSYECRRGCRCGIGSPFLYGKITAYLLSRSDCGCDAPASPPQRCSRRRWGR